MLSVNECKHYNGIVSLCILYIHSICEWRIATRERRAKKLYSLNADCKLTTLPNFEPAFFWNKNLFEPAKQGFDPVLAGAGRLFRPLGFR